MSEEITACFKQALRFWDHLEMYFSKRHEIELNFPSLDDVRIQWFGFDSITFNWEDLVTGKLTSCTILLDELLDIDAAMSELRQKKDERVRALAEAQKKADEASRAETEARERELLRTLQEKYGHSTSQ